MTEDIVNHLIDIKERLSSIEAKSDMLHAALNEHAETSAETRARVETIESELHQAKGSIKAVKWVFGVPAIIMALSEVVKNLLR